MNNYNSSPVEAGMTLAHDGSLDMEVLHDFGEGVGVDMRDFAHDIKDDHEMQNHLQPAAQITPAGVTNGMQEEPSSVNVDDMFQTETGLDGDDDDDDDDDGPKKRVKNGDVPGGFTYIDKEGESGRRKIRIEYITDKSRRHITFSKRKAGIMKKAYELSILTGTQVLLLVVSETGLVYTFTTTKLQPLVQKSEGKNLIQACLNAPDGFGPDGQPLTGPVAATKAKNGGLAIRPHKLTAAASAAMAASAQAAAALNPHEPIPPVNDQQASAAEAVGQGTPVSARPKKRLPSGRGKKNAAPPEIQQPNQDNNIPPVPQIPDIHRQNSPHQLNMQLQSPLSANYPYPHQHTPHDAYGHTGHHPHSGGPGPSPTSAAFGYPQSGDYSYYPPPTHHQQHPHQQHNGGPHGPQQPQHQGYLSISNTLQSPYGHSQNHSPGGREYAYVKP